ncbi:M20/M25/M40 family metallo-hydrolase [Halioglobus pacificus]|uniref:Vacuolar membrane protease n=1 Tax=Parahalioglobus pacificus TaxID=930806 RepID=A0A918XIG1_9GAMM|nr:M20/M25/M40 family metallo-hydrolase [Halioglobus pacificus]GHD32186.1 hypothetical protein GCM10007053_16030 [Halioglobus pacificus]
MKLLTNILGDGQPHPVGSAANNAVKERILEWLDAEGIQYEVQQSTGCSPQRQTCARVENIIARVPGTQPDAPALALMAHYDSVPTSMGAGDDGAGVAAILESARALIAQGPHRNTLLLLITDSEETGLHGAEAFFREHPLAPTVGLLLNVEGSGTGGKSQVLRTAGANRAFMTVYRDRSEYPEGHSISNEVFRRMPNDTDFSVAIRAGVPGIDFAFAGERNHYHTANDNLENLSPSTLQHHGENIFPLALSLLAQPLPPEADGNVHYMSVMGTWIQWPAGMSVGLALMAGLLLIISAMRVDHGGWLPLLGATSSPLLMLLVGGGLAYGALALVGAINGATPGWPAHLWPFRLVLIAASALGVLSIAAWLNQRWSVDTSLLGVWLFWWLCTLAVTLLAPDASPALLVPLVFAAIVLFAGYVLPAPHWLRQALVLMPASIAGVYLMFAGLLEQTQGYGLALAILPWLGLALLVVAPWLRGNAVKLTLLMTVMLSVVGMIAATTLPLYSAYRPQYVNIDYIENSDEKTALWRIRPYGEVPMLMLEAKDFSAPPRPVYPWSESDSEHVADAMVQSLPAPSLEIISDRITQEGRQVTMKLASSRGARWLQLIMPNKARVIGYEVNGVPMQARQPAEGGDYALTLFGIQTEAMTVTIDMEGKETLQAYLIDGAGQLPESSEDLIRARGSTATPVHSGDASLVYKTLSL